MNNKGIISVVILLIMAAIFTSGLIRAMIELSVFSILIGYVLLEKKKKTNRFSLNDKKPDK